MTEDVTVLLSAYDGAAFLPTQIDSIRHQKDVSWTLRVRDDGSPGEDTWQTLKGYAAADSRIQISRGDNLGAVASFFELLHAADTGAPYFAFADQDDYWLDDKLTRGVRALAEIDPDVPAAYGARVRIGDANLRPIGLTPTWPREPAFGNAVVENILGGCTLVMNRAARARMLETPRDRLDAVQMHDIWCYLICAAFGRVVFDPQPCMIYRQHARNCIGARPSPWHRFLGKLLHQVRGGSGPRLHRQAVLFRETYGDALTAADRALLDRFIDRPGPAGSLRTALDRRLWRQFPIDDLAMRVLIAIGRI